jgi:hypothetical protein
VVDVIEETFDVGVDNIAKFAILEVEAQLFDRFFGTPPWSIAIADGQEVLLVDGVGNLGAALLYQLIFQSRYP